MFLDYSVSNLVKKVFNLRYGTKKGNIPTPDIQVDYELNINNKYVTDMLNSVIAIRLQNEAISLILDSIEKTKEKSQPNTNIYLEEKNIEDFGSSYVQLGHEINIAIHALRKNSLFDKKIIEYNRENKNQRFVLKPIVLFSPLIQSALTMSGHGLMGYDFYSSLDIRLEKKIIILLSVKYLDYFENSEMLENLAFGNLYIEDEVIEGNKIIPHYKFSVNNFIFGVINFDSELLLNHKANLDRN